MAEEIYKYNLNNDATVIYKENKALPILSLQVWYNVGSIYENDKIAGISHFIEHMLFKGTQKRKINDIGPAIEKIGGHINAATSKDFTYYHTELPSEYLELGLDVLSDIAYNASFPGDEMERERMVILEEIKRSMDNPERTLYDLFMRALFYPNQYFSPVIGSFETVKDLKRTDLIDFYKNNYIPKKMTIVIVGDIDKEKIKDLVEKYFDKKEKVEETILDLKGSKLSEKIVSAKGNAVFPYLIYGTQTVDVINEDQYALDVLAGILGMGNLSRLNSKLKENERIVLSISCGHSTEKYCGFFYILANCEKNNVEKVKNRIKEEIALVKKDITDEEINRVRALIKTQFILETETNEGQAGRLGLSNVLGDYLLGEKYLEKIMKVKKEDILKVAGKYFNPDNFVEAEFLPEK